MDEEVAPTLLLSQLFPDALEDSYVATYCLLVVAPASALAARWLLSRGKRTTPRLVVLVSLLVPLALVGLPAVSSDATPVDTGHASNGELTCLRWRVVDALVAEREERLPTAAGASVVALYIGGMA